MLTVGLIISDVIKYASMFYKFSSGPMASFRPGTQFIAIAVDLYVEYARYM